MINRWTGGQRSSQHYVKFVLFVVVVTTLVTNDEYIRLSIRQRPDCVKILRPARVPDC